MIINQENKEIKEIKGEKKKLQIKRFSIKMTDITVQSKTYITRISKISLVCRVSFRFYEEIIHSLRTKNAPHTCAYPEVRNTSFSEYTKLMSPREVSFSKIFLYSRVI